MTKLHELQMQDSQHRETINNLLAKETRTEDEDRSLTEATAAMQKLQPELRAALAVADDAEADARAALAAGGAVDPEVRERAEIRSRTGLGDFLAAAAGGRSVEGAAAEFAASVGVGTFQRVPLAIFPQPEMRAITPGPAVDGPVEPHIPYVFERTAAASLGIQMPIVGAGQVQIPRVSTKVPADALAKDGAAPSTAAAISLDTQSPKRISGSFEIRVEDLAVYPALEDVLGETIRGSLGDELDGQIFNGSNSGGDLNGLFQQAANVSAATAKETYATGIARFAILVDGKHAYSLSDVRAVVGPSTFAAYMGLFHGGSGDVTLADYLMEKLGSFRVSDRMPAVSGTAQKGIVALSAGPSPIRVYTWSSLEVVRDPYSGAGQGKVTLTATALVSDVYIPFGQSMAKEVHPKLS